MERIGNSTKKAIRGLYAKRTGASRKVEAPTVERLQSEPAAATGRTTGPASTGATTQARIEETRVALESHKLEVAVNAVADVPDIRPEKAARIEELKAMIEKKSYEVDAEEVAKRLLATHLFDDIV